MKQETAPSKKYGDRLMAIKKSLMKDVVNYFENGKFEMNGPCTLYYPMEFGSVFTATFDTITGDENKLRLKMEGEVATVIGFEMDRGTESASADIYFLTKLVDFMWLDKREKERKANTSYA
jgi:hypothetical protein